MTGWLLAMVLAQGLDAASSCAVAHVGGGREAVPWIPVSSCQGIVAVKAGVGVSTAVAMRSLERQGHPRVAHWVAGLSIGAGSVAVTVNLRTLRGLR